MSKYCADCKYLNTKEAKKEGIYKCKESKEFSCSCNSACSKFLENYELNAYEKQILYDLGKKANTDETSYGVYCFLLFLLLLFGILLKILGY